MAVIAALVFSVGRRITDARSLRRRSDTIHAAGRQLHVILREPGTALEVLRALPLQPHMNALALLELGAVWRNSGGPKAPKRSIERLSVNTDSRVDGASVMLAAGEYLRVHTDPKRFPAVASVDWTSRIVHEDDEFVVIDKPAGIPSVVGVDNCVENVPTQLWKVGVRASAPNGRSGEAPALLPTTRLDVPTQGLLVYAKTLEFQREFNTLVQNGCVLKQYTAMVRALTAPIGKSCSGVAGRGDTSIAPLQRGETLVHWHADSLIFVFCVFFFFFLLFACFSTIFVCSMT
jgi:hypothetical protein